MLKIKKQALKKIYNLASIKEYEIFIFIFNIKFQGYIIENQISAIAVDKYGNELENFADKILDIRNLNDIYEIDNDVKNFNLDYSQISDLKQKAKNIIKLKTSIWKKEIKLLNDKIYNQEKKKKEKIYSHKRRTLQLKLESLNKSLERNQNNRPTARQLHNIEKISDEASILLSRDIVKKIEESLTFPGQIKVMVIRETRAVEYANK